MIDSLSDELEFNGYEVIVLTKIETTTYIESRYTNAFDDFHWKFF